jgi:hypothetical protein
MELLKRRLKEVTAENTQLKQDVASVTANVTPHKQRNVAMTASPSDAGGAATTATVRAANLDLESGDSNGHRGSSRSGAFDGGGVDYDAKGGQPLDRLLRTLLFSPAARDIKRGVLGYALLLHMWLFFRFFVGPKCIEWSS